MDELFNSIKSFELAGNTMQSWTLALATEIGLFMLPSLLLHL